MPTYRVCVSQGGDSDTGSITLLETDDSDEARQFVGAIIPSSGTVPLLIEVEVGCDEGDYARQQRGRAAAAPPQQGPPHEEQRQEEPEKHEEQQQPAQRGRQPVDRSAARPATRSPAQPQKGR